MHWRLGLPCWRGNETASLVAGAVLPAGNRPYHAASRRSSTTRARDQPCGILFLTVRLFCLRRQLKPPLRPKTVTDVFISYSTKDEALARHVHDYLLGQGVTAFLASISLRLGTEWEPSIRENLRQSPWVIFLASRDACRSPFVQQELGGAWLAGKQILPVVWDMAPDDLPGFLKKYQILDLRRGTLQDLQAAVARVAGQIKADKFVGLLVLGGLVVGVLWAASQSK